MSASPSSMARSPSPLLPYGGTTSSIDGLTDSSQRLVSPGDGSRGRQSCCRRRRYAYMLLSRERIPPPSLLRSPSGGYPWIVACSSLRLTSPPKTTTGQN